MIFFLEKLRKIFKSIGKKEKKINHLITYLKYKKKIKNYKLKNIDFSYSQDNNEKINIAATITFFFDDNKILNLAKACKSLSGISDKCEIHILTNNISSKQADKIKEEIKLDINLIVINDLIHDRLLPWYHLNVMKKLYSNEDITHFIYLEDDILLNKSNFNYWINSRKILKEVGLIPGFVRTEHNELDNQVYAIDFVKKSKLSLLPKFEINENHCFINNEFPYQGMYLYDRDLMKEHLFGPSSNPDCGHGAYNTDYIDERMINLDLMAKANIGLTYLNVPQGFLNRIVIPLNVKNQKIDSTCEIQHLSNKYANTTSSFGNIKIEEAIQ